MSDEAAAAVLQANDAFYRALSLADLKAMQQAWLDSPDAVCVHPGWPPLYGWQAIYASWQQIFESQGPLRIWASEAEVRLYGQTAGVVCLENIDTAQIAGAAILQTRANNLFRLVGGQWKMLEHHAAPVSGGGPRRLEPFSSN